MKVEKLNEFARENSCIGNFVLNNYNEKQKMNEVLSEKKYIFTFILFNRSH